MALFSGFRCAYLLLQQHNWAFKSNQRIWFLIVFLELVVALACFFILLSALKLSCFYCSF